jgi:hypothetical protein
VQIFDRAHSLGSHILEPGLEDLRVSPDPTRRAVAYNVMADHRVTRDREDLFLALAARAGAADVERLVREYFERRVRQRHLPDYVYDRINGDNILTDTAWRGGLIGKNMELVRIVNLNALWPVYENAPASLHLPRKSTDVRNWLDHIYHSSLRTQELWVGRILEGLHLHRRRSPFQPTWATSWWRFKTSVLDDPGSHPGKWAERLGVHVSGCPKWFIVLRYTVREAGTVARPTQLDAGFYAYHFPSPRAAPRVQSGHPMDLAVPCRTISLLPEFIHKQIDHPIEHWRNGLPSVGRVDAATSNDIASQRGSHHALLASHYPAVAAWMPVWL